MSRVKASTVLTRFDYLSKVYGPRAKERFLAELSESSRKQITGLVLPQAWVPFELYVEVNETIDRLFGKGDLALCVEVSKYAAEANLPTLYKVFYRLSSVAFIMKKAASLWNVHYDSGTLVVKDVDRSHALLTIRGFEPPHKTLCFGFRGWAARAIELSGGRHVYHDEAHCRIDKGGQDCDFRFEWD